MNLNKYTKSELISKLKKSDGISNNTNTKKGILNYNLGHFWDFLKISITKFGFFAILFKTFKKYSIFRRIYLLINGCVMAIFGISILDFYGLSFLSAFFAELDNIFGNIIFYIKNTYFYSVLSGIFAPKVVVEQPTIKMSTTDKITERDEKSHKISDWFNREEIVKEEESSNTKYYIIAGIIVLSCLTWYYWDNITPAAATIIESIKKRKPKQSGDDANVVITSNSKNIPTDNTLNIQDRLRKLKDSIKSKFYKEESTPPKINIDAVTQPSMISKASKTDVEEIDVLQSSPSTDSDYANRLFKNVDYTHKDTLEDLKRAKILQEANKTKLLELTNSDTKFKKNLVDFKLEQDFTGQTDLQNFINKSSETDSLLQNFFEYNNNSSFPKHAVKVALFQTIVAKIRDLQLKHNGLYYEWIKKDSIKERIESLFKLEKEILNENDYDELSKAASQEQEIWSERVNTPSAHSEKFNTQLEEDSPIYTSYAMDDQQVQDYKKELDRFVYTSNTENDQVASTSNNVTNTGPLLEEMPLLKDYVAETPNFYNQNEQPDRFEPLEKQIISIKEDVLSKNEFNDEIPQEEVKTGFNALFDQIRSKRDDTNVVSSAPVEQLGEHDVFKIDNIEMNLHALRNMPGDSFEEKKDNFIKNFKKYNSKDFNHENMKDILSNPNLTKEQTTNITNELAQKLDEHRGDPWINLVDLLKAIEKEELETVNKDDITRITEIKHEVNNPEIEIDNDTNSSMEHYFPKPEVTETEVKTGFNALFDQIRKKKDDSNVVASPNITHLGLGVKDSPKVLSPLQHKPSLNNMFDDTMNLFDDDADITIPQQDDIAPVQEDVTSEIPISWENITFEDAKNGTKIHFYEDWKNVHSVHFSTNNGHLKSYELDISALPDNLPTNKYYHTFNWKEDIGINNFPSPTVLKEIIIKDLNGNNHSIYKSK